MGYPTVEIYLGFCQIPLQSSVQLSKRTICYAERHAGSVNKQLEPMPVACSCN
jgi:hypothetical protein